MNIIDLNTEEGFKELTTYFDQHKQFIIEAVEIKGIKEHYQKQFILVYSKNPDSKTLDGVKFQCERALTVLSGIPHGASLERLSFEEKQRLFANLSEFKVLYEILIKDIKSILSHRVSKSSEQNLYQLLSIDVGDKEKFVAQLKDRYLNVDKKDYAYLVLALMEKKLIEHGNKSKIHRALVSIFEGKVGSLQNLTETLKLYKDSIILTDSRYLANLDKVEKSLIYSLN